MGPEATRLRAMRKPLVVVPGEVLWDLLPTGPVLGGAPANFAWHTHGLGAEVRLMTRVGRDPLGEEIIRRFTSVALPLETVEVDEERPTGTVGVTFDEKNQPHYKIHGDVAWDQLRSTSEARQLIARADIVCFGSLIQRTDTSRAALRSLLTLASVDAWRIFDINLRAPYYSKELIEESLALANVLKLNDDELGTMAEWFGIYGTERELLAGLARRFNLKAIALTRGARGSLLMLGKEFSDHEGVPVQVRDTIGAGDSFTSAVALGLYSGWPLARVNAHAAQVAAFVCTQPGGMPRLPGEFRVYPF